MDDQLLTRGGPDCTGASFAPSFGVATPLALRLFASFSSLSALKKKSNGDSSFRGGTATAGSGSGGEDEPLLSDSLSKRVCIVGSELAAGIDLDKNLGRGILDGAGDA